MPIHILVVGCQHGNERLGARIQRFLHSHQGQYPTVSYICGNPRAYRTNVRMVETDLNRSYVEHPQGYEEKRAQKILRFIQKNHYDYIFDIHITTADTDRFYLVAGLSKRVKTIIAASTITEIAVMSPAIARHSLIGNVPNAVSIEYNEEAATTDNALQEILAIIDNLLQSRSEAAMERHTYQVLGVIPREAQLETSAANFCKSSLGYYPILLGEESYKPNQGFAGYERMGLKI